MKINFNVCGNEALNYIKSVRMFNYVVIYMNVYNNIYIYIYVVKKKYIHIYIYQM